MSIRVDTSSWITGAIVVGNRGLGVLGASIPATGDNGASFLYNDLSLPADNGKEICGRITSWPASGTLAAYEDGSFDFSGAADGTYSFQYTLLVDGVSNGTGTVSLQVGSPVTSFAITTADAAAAFAARVSPVAAFNLSTGSATFAGGAGTLAAAAFSVTTEGATSALSARVVPQASVAITTGDALAAFSGTSKPVAVFSLSPADVTFTGGGGTIAAGSFTLVTSDATFTGSAETRPRGQVGVTLDNVVFSGGATPAGTPATCYFTITTDDAVSAFNGEVLPAGASGSFAITLGNAAASFSAIGQAPTGLTLSQADIDAIAAAVLQALASLQPGVVQVNVTNPDQIAAGVWGFTVQ